MIVNSYPSIQAIGWVPYFKKFAAQPIGNYSVYAQQSFFRKLACTLLFLSGNIPEPLNIKTEKEFDDFLKTKNYRGALRLSNISLPFDKNGPLDGDYDPLKADRIVGFTPYRIPYFGRRWRLSNPQGELYRSHAFEVKPKFNRINDDAALLSYHIGFRIGKVGRKLASALTGYFVPFVHLTVHYLMRRDGSFEVHFAGSHIPSQYCKVIGHGEWRHDMLNIGLSEIIDFFEAKTNNELAQQYKDVKIV